MQHNSPTAKPVASAVRAAGRRLALLWLVLALICQGVVTQAHAHVDGDRSWAAAAPTATPVVAADGKKHLPATPACPLCEEKALFGAYLLTGSVAIARPVEAADPYATTSLPLLALRLSSHAWRSRAPPASTI